MLKGKQFIFAIVVIVAASLNSDNLLAQTTIPVLFDDVRGLYVSQQLTRPKHIMRERYVRLNPKLVASLLKAVAIDNNGNPPDIHKFPKFSFNLFPDANYVRAEITEINDTSVSGKLANEAGFFQLVISEQAFVAHINVYRPSPGEFEISSAGNNVYKIIQINQAKFAPD